MTMSAYVNTNLHLSTFALTPPYSNTVIRGHINEGRLTTVTRSPVVTLTKDASLQ